MKNFYVILLLLLVSSFSFSFADSQLDGAVSWMHSNGLTKFDNASDFMSTQSLRRDEATKFFVQYAKESLGLSPDTSKSCNFTDLDKARPDLKDLIKESCQLGLFQGYNGKFMPTQSLTNAQAITVLIRMIDGNKDETQGHWAQKYFEKAQSLQIMDGLSLNSTTKFDRLTTRGDVGILIFNTFSIGYAVNSVVVEEVEEVVVVVEEVLTSSETVIQKNAVEKAKSYLDYSAFSHDGLVAQLEYEQFSHSDAVYGADNSSANWNEQAIEKAKSYLDYSAFSHDGLVAQLEYDKFTQAQAEYGADNSYADWNEQATEKAKSYMEYSAFSRGSLIEQLKYDKFTQAQAEYGANAVGL